MIRSKYVISTLVHKTCDTCPPLRLVIPINSTLRAKNMWRIPLFIRYGTYRVGLTQTSSQVPVSDSSESRHIFHLFRWQTMKTSQVVSVTNNATRYTCHISRKNVTLSHTNFFLLTCDVFCHILPGKRHILAPPVQNFFEREEMWRFGWDWNMLFSRRLRFVTYLASVKREGLLG